MFDSTALNDRVLKYHKQVSTSLNGRNSTNFVGFSMVHDLCNGINTLLRLEQGLPPL